MGDAPLRAIRSGLGILAALLLVGSGCGGEDRPPPRETSAPAEPAAPAAPAPAAGDTSSAPPAPAASGPPPLTLSADCHACHDAGSPALAAPVDSTYHAAQERLYAGGDGISPAPMHEARVDCAQCHSAPARSHPRGSAERAAAINGECQACHGESFDWMLPEWVETMSRHTEDVGRFVRRATESAGIGRVEAAKQAADRADRTWRIVERGNGIHHVVAADSLLRAALTDAREAYALAGLSAPAFPRLGPDPSEQSCARCHYGADRHAGSFAGRTFDHAPHVASGIDCATCHSDVDLFHRGDGALDANHGRTIATSASCAACHHRQHDPLAMNASASCAVCHDASALEPASADVPVQVGRREARLRSVPWTHERHEGLECAACHPRRGSVATTPEVSSCTACHDEHHAEGRTCATCHSVEESLAVHSVDDHLACAECHARETVARVVPDRAACLVCHADQADHYVESSHECSTCHFLQSPHELRDRILGEGTR